MAFRCPHVRRCSSKRDRPIPRGRRLHNRGLHCAGPNLRFGCRPRARAARPLQRHHRPAPLVKGAQGRAPLPSVHRPAPSSSATGRAQAVTVPRSCRLKPVALDSPTRRHKSAPAGSVGVQPLRGDPSDSPRRFWEKKAQRTSPPTRKGAGREALDVPSRDNAT